jgi:hypothetical protein
MAIFLFAVFLHTLFPYTTLGTLEFSTHLSWVLQLAALAYLFRRARRESAIPALPGGIPVHLFALMLAVYSIAGVLATESYWDFKGLIDMSLGMGLFAVVYAGSAPGFFVSTKDVFLYRLAPVVVFTAVSVPGFVLDDACIGYSLILSSLLLCLGRYLRPRDLFFALLYAVLLLVLDTGTRSNVLKVLFPVVALVALLPISKFMPRLAQKTGRFLLWLLVVAPVIFFALAATGTFNVFAPDFLPDDLAVRQRSGDGTVSEVRKTDTRTFIYLEVLTSAEEKDSYLLGRTPARGYNSSAFGALDVNDRGERLRSEVGVLNYFTWFGILGVVLYYAVFIRGMFLAAYRSNNSACLLLAIYSGFNLTYSWVENFTAFNMPNLVIWLALGLCYSPSFRALTDDGVRRVLYYRRQPS